ncbi:MAG: hypothetical protein VX910_06970 [Candidatus Latescibacterota bacterium]|nr:hypothetical protein [Candidatus Latescibacterota bacterium]
MKNSKHYVPALLLILLMVSLGFASSDTRDSTNKVLRPIISERGVVTFAEGRVEIRREDAEWEQLYTGDCASAEDSIRTSSKGRTEVSWGNPRRLLRIERESIVALSGANFGNRLVLVGARVDKGAVWVEVHGKRLSFTLSSPSVRSIFQKAMVSLRVADDSSRLAVYQGEVDLNGQNLVGGDGVFVTGDVLNRFSVGVEDDLRDGWRDVVNETLITHDGFTEQSSQVLMLTQDLRNLSPEIYLGVEVELTGSSNKEDFEAEIARIRKIRVKSVKWDGLLARKKIKLLNDTFRVLKESYPVILSTVVIEFDDKRPNLSLKYAAAG